MRKFFIMCTICTLLASLLLAPCANASLDSDTITSKEEADGPLLLADYPADEFSSSFQGQTNGSYTETYSYEDVGVMVHNLRHTLFGGQFDEILFLNNNYGPIQEAELIDIDEIDGSYLTVRMRFECDSDAESGPEKWIADVVKVYSGEYYFMFVVARDADGKNYAKKVDTLIDSLRLGTANEAENISGAADTSEENLFAPRESD